MYIDPYSRFYLRLSALGLIVAAVIVLANLIGRLFGRPLRLF